ncbi:hypothetical protein Q1695_007340 [Nippostrongylus brasiliensis]|nr:hypothetical protein Q1695_007340 [Nippostrongylus brasiliensis]
MEHTPSNDCQQREIGQLFDVAEKICEYCHEVTSNEKLNVRSECRADCFSSDHFRMCVSIFSGLKVAPKRHVRSHYRVHRSLY